ncbi:hypothetical protein Taro_052347 [Colocasia esculenta]|uniref:Uncharacterized protein n=1 Tax=Colocasia esculenta TaxID=4460 RepID=A0A843XJS3_COLES|nr:hypothetical protein [Colocasia esculenta]
MLTPSASRPTENSVGLVSSSGDVDYVDAISFKTCGKLHRPDVGHVDAISFKTYGKLHMPGSIIWCWNL